MHIADTGRSETLSREVVLDIWTTILDIDNAGDDDNFFDLGGDSLLAVDFTAVVGERLGVDLALDEFFDNPTFGSVVDRVRALTAEN